MAKRLAIFFTRLIYREIRWLAETDMGHPAQDNNMRQVHPSARVGHAFGRQHSRAGAQPALPRRVGSTSRAFVGPRFSLMLRMGRGL